VTTRKTIPPEKTLPPPNVERIVLFASLIQKRNAKNERCTITGVHLNVFYVHCESHLSMPTILRECY
jgi:hypothetical protein